MNFSTDSSERLIPDDGSPVRVHLSRRKGWRMPPNTVKVSRPTKWGNPYKVGEEVLKARRRGDPSALMWHNQLMIKHKCCLESITPIKVLFGDNTPNVDDLAATNANYLYR